ncbi:discoidin domain-containing protein [Flagellimonas eckloniae]|uniref:F5/8 type C domain-containing protein n=1 Tax=Flagellimonas eckloniae TaxID=346185 RepID=A0A0Q1DIX7_9FLAO|nr:discoidin domain-containing protein [Allomuricauda eckloniae]KQC28679.1 hypothetical protein AAY42_01255 [Allomuricauda eckloniae]
MKNTNKLILIFLKKVLFLRIKAVVLLTFLIVCSDIISAQTSEVPWMEGSWGVRLIIRGGEDLDTFVTNGYDYVEEARRIVRDYPTMGHVITNFTNNANGSLFLLRENPDIPGLANQLHPRFFPSIENEQIILDVIQVFKDAGIKVILYMKHRPGMGDGTTAQINSWNNYTGGTNNFQYFEEICAGFAKRFDGLIDGYWIDNFGGANTTIPAKTSFVNALLDAHTIQKPVIATNWKKSYFSGIQVDSDGPGERDPDNYQIIKYQANDIWSDYTHGHVTSIGGQKAPSNSFGYDEFTLPDFEVSGVSVSSESGKTLVKHMFAPIRRRWSQYTEPLYYEEDQAYRFVKRITDAGGAITFSTTIGPGGIGPADEIRVLKHVDAQLAANADYVPYVRPAGAFLVGETTPNYNQVIDFKEIDNKQVGDPDFFPFAYASSGASVTLTSSNTSVATIVNGNIRIQGEGTTNITASQGGNSTFAAAPNVVRQLTVTSGGTGGTTNLALNGTATQSTTLAGAVASRANDGDTNGNFGGNSVSAAEGPNAWWEVDLGDNYEIDDINVFNRTNNCCSSRLSDFTVSVINSGGTTTFTQTITTAPNPSVTLDAGGVTGQVVRIQSNLTTTLNLAEVEVYGSESSKLDQTITFNLPAKQLGDADFDPATASSGYNISYTSSNTNVATIVNGNIRIVGVGTSEITASQAGNVVYNPAPSVTRTLVVTDGNTGGTTNLALNGTATQSTTLGGAEASRAIDGDTNGNFSGGSISAAEGPNAWWEVDLGGNYNIDDINVFNRTNNCCSSRLSDFTVSVINSSGTTTYTQTITTAPNPSVTLDAGGAVGQVVRIQSNLTTTLNLAEVEVYGSQSNTNNTITIQENTTGFCDVDGVIQSADAGYTGSGYANTSNALGRAIDWEIDGTAGSYTFVWRYLVGSARTADLIVDGTTVATGISFVNTQGGWLTAEATVGLGAGVKSVILSSTSSTGLAKIDYLEVTGPNVVASACASSSLKTSLDLKAPDTDTEDILHFYPNPTTDILHVEVNGSNDAQLDIINSSGQNVISKHMGNGRTSVDMTRLPLGLYILKVTDQKQVRTKKIIKK